MNIKEYVVSFGEFMGIAISNLQNAANCYVKACREFPEEAQEEFEKAYPHVSACTWEKLLMVGHGDLHPAALLLSNKFCAKIARMPKHKQDVVLNGDSFEVVNDTTRKVERVNYGAIKPRHEAILFDDKNTTIRTIPQQIAYLDAMKAERLSKAKDYAVHSDHLEVFRACIIGKNELEKIVEDMN